MLSIFVQFLIAVLAIWSTWKFIRAFVLFRVEESEPAEPADDPFAFVGAPVKRGPKGLTGAVALNEPDDEGLADCIARPAR